MCVVPVVVFEVKKLSVCWQAYKSNQYDNVVKMQSLKIGHPSKQVNQKHLGDFFFYSLSVAEDKSVVRVYSGKLDNAQ